MAQVTRDRGTAPADDGAAIEELHEVFDLQKRAFAAERHPSLDVRRERLGALAAMMLGARERIREAVAEDFGSHPALFADIVEVLGVAGRAAYAIENLEAWMKDEQRPVDPALFGSGRAFVRYQPKGVVGNIVPWNFPYDIGVGPVVEMLAAGNRVIIKPSDYTPACGELLREIVAETFDRDLVSVVVGGLDLARTFTTLRWDHLLYTGSPAVGREVMRAAADNLVPVTLELGGKCPAIVAPDAVDEDTVRNIVGVKLIKNGQMCISVDYCLVPRDRMDDFVSLVRRHVQDHLEGYSQSADVTGIITRRHFERLARLVEGAEASGGRVVRLEETAEVDPSYRRMPLSLVVDPPDDTTLMQEEIFGPILPLKGYDSIDDAIAYVNEGERPLALYVFTHDEQVSERVLGETISGGACVNACAMHGALPSVGFGGVGQSGMGRHHGVEGFREFSNPRGVFVRGEGDLADAFVPPYGELAEAVVEFALAEEH
jgi:coniferyl-aldehyde dehydrogenase